MVNLSFNASASCPNIADNSTIFLIRNLLRNILYKDIGAFIYIRQNDAIYHPTQRQLCRDLDKLAGIK